MPKALRDEDGGLVTEPHRFESTKAKQMLRTEFPETWLWKMVTARYIL